MNNYYFYSSCITYLHSVVLSSYHREILNDSIGFGRCIPRLSLMVWLLVWSPKIDTDTGGETEGLPENLQKPEVSRRRLLMVQKSQGQPPGIYFQPCQ